MRLQLEIYGIFIIKDQKTQMHDFFELTHSDLGFEIRGINSKFFDPGYIFTNQIQGWGKIELRFRILDPFCLKAKFYGTKIG